MPAFLVWSPAPAPKAGSAATECSYCHYSFPVATPTTVSAHAHPRNPSLVCPGMETPPARAWARRP